MDSLRDWGYDLDLRLVLHHGIVEADLVQGIVFIEQVIVVHEINELIGGEGLLGEIADSVLHTGSNDEVLRFLLLHNQPHALNVVLSVSSMDRNWQRC